MTAKEGRKRSISCLVAVGNGQGAAGMNSLGASFGTPGCRALDHNTKQETIKGSMNSTKSLFGYIAELYRMLCLL